MNEENTKESWGELVDNIYHVRVVEAHLIGEGDKWEHWAVTIEWLDGPRQAEQFSFSATRKK